MAPSVPAALAEAVEGYDWSRDRVGMSGAAVYRLRGRRGAPDLYLKLGCGGVADDVAEEAEKLRWLQSRLPVPRLRAFVAETARTWLLTEALPGRTAWQVMTGNVVAREAVIRALAGFLCQLHAIPAGGCPFDASARVRLAEAKWRLDAGLVDEADFDDARQGWSAHRVWDAMMALDRSDSDFVVTHGDFSLDNVLFDGGEVTGCIDLDRLGVADRYQDIAVMWNNLSEFGPELQRSFLTAYGIDQPDEGKLAFYLMLDEMF